MSYATPIVIESPKLDLNSPTTVVFLHGLGNDAHGWTDLVTQIQSASKLPHVKWILPNAPKNRDAMAQDWFSEDGVEDEDNDDETGMMQSVDYICSLIDEELATGKVLPERIVIGGFSQGCTISLLVALRSRYAGKLRGIIGLSGYLPLQKKIATALEAQECLREQPTRYFLVHGARDQIVARWVYTRYKEKLEDWVGGNVTARMYESLGHATCGSEVRDLCDWLEKIL